MDNLDWKMLSLGWIGGFIAAYFTETKSKFTYFIYITTGGISSYTTGPLVAKYLHKTYDIPVDDLLSLSGFLCGLCSMLIVEYIIKKAKDYVSKNN